MDRRGIKFWDRLPLEKKILMEVTLMALALFASNLFIYWQVNRTTQKMDTVYASNVNLSELSDTLEEVQQGLYSCISIQSSETLENYYRSEQEYRNLLHGLNQKMIDNPIKILERNIRNMSESYLDIAAEAVQAKRGRNVEKYKDCYETASKHYQYINDYISQLNNLQFRNNSARYLTLQQGLKYMEVVSSLILICVMVVGISILMMITRDIVNPLTNLAHTANLVGQGCFHLKMPDTGSEDEIGILTRTFNKMIASLEEYVGRIRESAEKEQKMMEKELLMETHLKEAQLKYLQSQINPHFLFNSLNAGAQLAVMEDAEKTCTFLERMADFFRYNVKKSLEDAAVGEEVEAVENYIYILNVRFDGDIHYEADIDEDAESIRMPSMILQPIVENAVNHGIRNIDWEGKISLTVKRSDGILKISVRDNGKGMSSETICRILNRGEAPQGVSRQGSSTGIGMDNVRNRLEMYYDCKDIMSITSEGENKGTEVTLMIPLKEGKDDVPDFIGG
ncbi:histidine kinase [Clostridium sp. AM58-1XD]|uniref:sensor histidine kinase n=1 Tax=Clostridium sp. AM58-1XD TaxID=2292307 RepID=UPI000E5143F4|nr:histidine kinase [Clostridium sp. AM58-1XD]RGY96453.1 HAMP domain-containing protein [Clostridium sp. AM58-1XD]